MNVEFLCAVDPMIGDGHCMQRDISVVLPGQRSVRKVHAEAMVAEGKAPRTVDRDHWIVGSSVLVRLHLKKRRAAFTPCGAPASRQVLSN